MPPSDEPRARFEEQAALEELERLRRALELSRQRRKHANEEFDTFLRSFQRRPAPAASDTSGTPEQPRFARAPEGEPRPRDVPEPPPQPILSRRPDRPSIEPASVVGSATVIERAAVVEAEPAVAAAPVQAAPALPPPPAPSSSALPDAITGGIDRDEEHLSDLPSETHAAQVPVAPSTGVASLDDRGEEAPEVPHAARPEYPHRGVRDPRLVAVLAVMVIAAVFLVYRVLSHPGPGTPASGQEAAPSAAAPAPSARPAERLAPTPPPVPPARVQLTTTRLVWVRVTADGVKTVERELPPGTTIPIDADQSIVVRAGDAGAVRMVIDGKDQGPLGPDGVVRTRAFTPPG
jgi:hypothetical protein